MADINESPLWEDGIELIGRTERVSGGQDGVANRPLKKLVNRTRYLKERFDETDADISSKVEAVKTFEEGATLNSPRDEILYGNYRLVWTGWFPKDVPAASTPFNTGGIGAGAWAYTSDAAIRDNLNAVDGLAMVGQCPDINRLRMIKFDAVGKQIFLKEHTSGQGMGGGTWYCHSLTNDNNYVDDDGCQIINNHGQVLRRKDLRIICSDMFGLMNGGDYIACLRNMFKASRTFCIEEVLVAKLPFGQSVIADTLSDGSNGFVADVSDGMNFTIRGLGVGTNGPRIQHKGNGVMMRIKRNHASSKDFWVTCGFECLRVAGINDTLDGNNTYTGATPFQVSDMWGSLFKDLYVSGYDNNTGGSAISLYNDTAWTEKPRFDNVMIRGSVVGLRLHRNTAEGAGATDSFFAVSGEIDMNAGVPNPCSYIRVGDGTEKGKCTMYSAQFTIRGWMSRSSWHTGIDIMDYSCVTGKMTFIWDGYGLSSNATSEVLHIIRTRGVNARFDCEVTNLSGQLLACHILRLVPRFPDCVFWCHLQQSNFRWKWGSCLRKRPERRRAKELKKVFSYESVLKKYEYVKNLLPFCCQWRF